MIDGYARNEGTTRGEMRPARNLDKTAPPTSIDRPAAVDATESRARRLRDLSDALATVALELNTGVQRSASILGTMWRRMASPNPVDAPYGGLDVAEEYFSQMIDSGLWVNHGTSKKGYSMYCPVVLCAGCLRDVYMFEIDSNEPTHMEVANRKSLMEYGESEARWSNNLILRNFYKMQADKKEKQGRKKSELIGRKDKMLRLSNSQDAYLREFKKLIKSTESLPINDSGCVTYLTRYRHSQGEYKGRLYAEGTALSKTPKRLRQVAYKGLGVEDWDIRMAYFTFAAQAVEKLKVQMHSPYFRLDTVKVYLKDREKVWTSLREIIDAIDDEFMRLRNAVFNGGSIEGRFRDNTF